MGSGSSQFTDEELQDYQVKKGIFLHLINLNNLNKIIYFKIFNEK